MSNKVKLLIAALVVVGVLTTVFATTVAFAAPPWIAGPNTAFCGPQYQGQGYCPGMAGWTANNAPYPGPSQATSGCCGARAQQNYQGPAGGSCH